MNGEEALPEQTDSLRNQRALDLGRRVYWSAVIAWSMVGATIVVHYAVNPFRTERGNDFLMLYLAIPALLWGYGLYTSVLYIIFRRYRTKPLILGLAIHVLGAIIAMVVLGQATGWK